MSIHNDPQKPPAAGVILLVVLFLVACMLIGLSFGAILEHGTKEMVKIGTGAIVLFVLSAGVYFRRLLK